MSNQNVSFGDVGSSDENNAASIQPFSDGEDGMAAVFNRPPEVLRQRTEVMRQVLEDFKYLTDADRAMLLNSTGTGSWNIDSGTDLGVFALQSDPLIMRPFLAPATNMPAWMTFGDDTHQFVIRTTTTPTGPCPQPPRAYNGANKISVQVIGTDNGSYVAPTLSRSGNPADDVVITVNTNAGAGTTCSALMGFLNGNSDFQALGLIASLGPDCIGTNIVTPVGTTVLNGAADAEMHKITAAALIAFFGISDSNKMSDGDVLAIRYDALVMTPPDYGGRRQSLGSAPESTIGRDETDVGNNLFLLKNHPEYLANALPICARVGSQLIFVNGVRLNNGEMTPICQGYVTAIGSLPGGTVQSVLGKVDLDKDLKMTLMALNEHDAFVEHDLPVGTWFSICWGPAGFLAVGAGGVAAFSTDGTTWTPTAIPAYDHLTSVYGANKYVVARNGGDNNIVDVFNVVDSTWSSVTVPTGPFTSFNLNVIYDGTQFIAFSGAIAISSDGVTWTAISGLSLPAGTAMLLNMAFNGTVYLALAGMSAGLEQLQISANLATWTTVSTFPGQPSPSALTWKTASRGSYFVLTQIADDVGHTATSPDGVNWTVRGPIPACLLGITSLGNLLIATGMDDPTLTDFAEGGMGGMYISIDNGDTWSPILKLSLSSVTLAHCAAAAWADQFSGYVTIVVLGYGSGVNKSYAATVPNVWD